MEKKADEDNTNKVSSEELYNRILQIISTLSEVQLKKLLEALEKWRKPKFKEKRKYPRKQTLIWVECSGGRCNLYDFVQNMSVSGLFIETLVPFFVGEELSMSLSLPGEEDPKKIHGKIVRVETRGIGVQLDELLTDI